MARYDNAMLQAKLFFCAGRLSTSSAGLVAARYAKEVSALIGRSQSTRAARCGGDACCWPEPGAQTLCRDGLQILSR